jgi:hypothetical protein
MHDYINIIYIQRISAKNGLEFAILSQYAAVSLPYINLALRAATARTSLTVAAIRAKRDRWTSLKMAFTVAIR